MDHIGKASGKLHRTIDIDDVLKFVKWDVGYNKEFTVGCVTLSQGEKGVPIGGFLSAQLCVLWGMYREGLLLHETSLPLLLDEVLEKWNPSIGSLSLHPRGTLTFPNVVTVPRDREEFHNSGMNGWVKPENKTFARAIIDNFPVDIAAVCLWDAHPEGRVGQLLRTAPKSQHRFLVSYFSSIDQARCVTSEVSQIKSCLDGRTDTATEGYLVMGRYVDNIYISAVDIPPRLRPTLEAFLELFLTTLYQLPLKWEPSPEARVSWLEASIHTDSQATSHLTMKGVSLQPLSGDTITPDFEVWKKWMDAKSPNIQFALRSSVPNTTGKTLMLCSSVYTRLLNLGSLIRGFGYMGYKWKWWWRPFINTITKKGMGKYVRRQKVQKWFDQGTKIASEETREPQT